MFLVLAEMTDLMSSISTAVLAYEICVSTLGMACGCIWGGTSFHAREMGSSNGCVAGSASTWFEILGQAMEAWNLHWAALGLTHKPNSSGGRYSTTLSMSRNPRQDHQTILSFNTYSEHLPTPWRSIKASFSSPLYWFWARRSYYSS